LLAAVSLLQYFRGKMIAQFFANNKPPPASVNIATAKSETIPNLLIAVRRSRCRCIRSMSPRTSTAASPTIMFTAGASGEIGTALLQMSTRPSRATSPTFQGVTARAQISLESRQANWPSASSDRSDRG